MHCKGNWMLYWELVISGGSLYSTARLYSGCGAFTARYEWWRHRANRSSSFFLLPPIVSVYRSRRHHISPSSLHISCPCCLSETPEHTVWVQYSLESTVYLVHVSESTRAKNVLNLILLVVISHDNFTDSLFPTLVLAVLERRLLYASMIDRKLTFSRGGSFFVTSTNFDDGIVAGYREHWGMNWWERGGEEEGERPSPEVK